MGALSTYHQAMRLGDMDACIRIEQRHGLFGYPPEIVSIGLAAIDSGFDPHEVIEQEMGKAEAQEPQR